jgi:hypothetical protein
MRLWKSDHTSWTVREVEGDPYPGKDEEGDTCYVNTHFAATKEAIENLKSNVDAYVSITADRVIQARKAFVSANEEAANAVVAAEKARKLIDNEPAGKACVLCSGSGRISPTRPCICAC